MKHLRLLFSVVMIWTLCIATLSQSGGNFSITSSVIGGGGGQNSTGGTYNLAGTIGQADAGGPLTGGTYSVSGGFWHAATPLAQGFEGDVAPRPNGNTVVDAPDLTQVQRFSIGLDVPNQLNEFQRADTAPFATLGDGDIEADDVTQTQRYSIGLEPTQNAGGPFGFAEGIASQEGGTVTPGATSKGEVNDTVGPRRLFIQNITGSPGNIIDIEVRVDAIGDESAYGFRVNYPNTGILNTNPTTFIGTAGGSRLCNAAVAGQVTCSVNNFPDDLPGSSTDQIGEIPKGLNQQLLRVRFTIQAAAPNGVFPITITNTSASNDAAQALTLTTTGGNLTITGSTSAATTASGRVVTADGQGIRNAIVQLTATNGEVRIARTGAFGYFSFEGIPVGHTYVFAVQSKRYTFAQPTQTRFISDAVEDINFTAQPEGSPGVASRASNKGSTRARARS